jgi:hypothetical protein
MFASLYRPPHQKHVNNAAHAERLRCMNRPNRVHSVYDEDKALQNKPVDAGS